MNIYLSIILSVLLCSEDLISQNGFYIKCQEISPDHPQIVVYEYHEWSPTTQFSMVLDSSEAERTEVVEYDERGLPASVNIEESPTSLNTIRPFYKNTEEGFTIRSVGYPKDFLTDPQVIQILEDNLVFDWEIHSDQKEIGGIRCIKATTEFRCRKFTAWFAPDINIPAGPLFFDGLPGLIVKLDIEKEDVYFELREFGNLERRTLTPEVLGLDLDDMDAFKTHCDLESIFDEYVELLLATLGNPDCRTCPSKVENVYWRECWDECD